MTAECAAVAALKRNVKIPIKKKVGPRITLLREKKALAGTIKTPLLKTKKGSISKVRRVFPGASSSSTTSTVKGSACLRDTSSDGGSTVISTGRKFGPHPEDKSSQNNEEKVASKLANKILVPA